MGLFSWLTSDTNESIRVFGPRPVYLLQPNGEPPLEQPVYEGYGVFGGVDAYEWLADMNGVPRGDGERRGDGIELEFSGREIEYPLKFSFNKDAVYEELKASKYCPNQGFFFDNDDEDDSYCHACGRDY